MAELLNPSEFQCLTTQQSSYSLLISPFCNFTAIYCLERIMSDSKVGHSIIIREEDLSFQRKVLGIPEVNCLSQTSPASVNKPSHNQRQSFSVVERQAERQVQEITKFYRVHSDCLHSTCYVQVQLCIHYESCKILNFVLSKTQQMV